MHGDDAISDQLSQIIVHRHAMTAVDLATFRAFSNADKPPLAAYLARRFSIAHVDAFLIAIRRDLPRSGRSQFLFSRPHSSVPFGRRLPFEGKSVQRSHPG
jgi:hypothetical protein